ncbi:MAG: helix-turn-helix domain-containing protein [Clostridia bacterium]|nr:helix-turn-helix domain-containing protein [Clostridia bacterium]
MNIGYKIRELRKKRGITQEQLANVIGVSFQAVSKWENGIALPDITLAPVLAKYFGVSMDELFDYSMMETEEKVRAITEESYRYRLENNWAEGRRVIEEGLKEFPDNDILLNNLLYVINYTENPDETLKFAARILEITKEDDVRFDTYRFMAYAYKAKNDPESAEKILEKIPEIYFTKLTEVAYLMEGETKREAADKQKWISFENLIQMMEKLAECYEADGKAENARTEREKALKLVEIMNNDGYFDNYAEFFRKKIGS